MTPRVPTLVLRRFKINPNGGDQPCIELIGRPSGLLAWVLTIMGLNTETTLRVTDLALSVKSASLFGEFTDFVPLPHMSSTHCGFSKPISYLGIALAAIVFGFITGMNQRRDGSTFIIIGLVIALLFVIGYFLSKKILMQFITDGSYPLKIMFKPSVLEGVPIDINYTIQALSLLNQKVLEAA